MAARCLCLASLAAMATSDPADVLAFQSRLPGGQEAVALLNTSTSSARTVTFRSGLPLSGQLRTWTYSAGNQNAWRIMFSAFLPYPPKPFARRRLRLARLLRMKTADAP